MNHSATPDESRGRKGLKSWADVPESVLLLAVHCSREGQCILLHPGYNQDLSLLGKKLYC